MPHHPRPLLLLLLLLGGGVGRLLPVVAAHSCYYFVNDVAKCSRGHSDPDVAKCIACANAAKPQEPKGWTPCTDKLISDACRGIKPNEPVVAAGQVHVVECTCPCGGSISRCSFPPSQLSVGTLVAAAAHHRPCVCLVCAAQSHAAPYSRRRDRGSLSRRLLPGVLLAARQGDQRKQVSAGLSGRGLVQRGRPSRRYRGVRRPSDGHAGKQQALVADPAGRRARVRN
jgi:hypothetical protein